jgi:hypothetical protein
MAIQFDPKSSGTTRKPSSGSYLSLGDDMDWNPKMGDIDVTSREIGTGSAISRFDKRSSLDSSGLDPVADLKNRLSMWGKQTDIELVGTKLTTDRSELPRRQKRVRYTGWCFNGR